MRKGIGLMAASLVASAVVGRPALQGSEPPVVHTVKMVMEGNAPRFVPQQLTIQAGDQVRFVNVSGGPHNVAFDTARVTAEVERILTKAMPDQIQPLSGPLLTEPNSTYTISFAGIEPGMYELFCLPHLAMGMKGSITVK